MKPTLKLNPYLYQRRMAERQLQRDEAAQAALCLFGMVVLFTLNALIPQ